MAKVESVPQFMDAFFEQTLTQQFVIAFQSVELLAQPVGGHHRTRTSHLRFAKHILEDWNVQIDVRDGQQPAAVG